MANGQKGGPGSPGGRPTPDGAPGNSERALIPHEARSEIRAKAAALLWENGRNDDAEEMKARAKAILAKRAKENPAN